MGSFINYVFVIYVDIMSIRNSRSIYLIFNYMYTLFWRRQWHPTPVLLPGKFHGQRSLVGCSPWGREESETTERLHFHFSVSCTGEGNGNPLQGSCLENPRDGGAWWAAIYGVAQRQTRLKRISISSSSSSSKYYRSCMVHLQMNTAVLYVVIA